MINLPIPKFMAVRAFYYNCPACDGPGDPEVIIYYSIEGFLEEYSTETRYRYYNLWSISPFLLIAELSDTYQSHHVASKDINLTNGRSFKVHTTSPLFKDYIIEILEEFNKLMEQQ